MRCNAKPSRFAYQEGLPEEKEEVKKRAETAVLSTTAKAKAKAKAKAGTAANKTPKADGNSTEKPEEKKADAEPSAMDVDGGESTTKDGKLRNHLSLISTTFRTHAESLMPSRAH